MHRFRALLMVCFAALSGLALFVSRSDAVPDTLKLVVPGVWFREGDLKDKGHCNNIIIEMKDYLIVVDANFPSGARLAMAEAKRVSSKPVKYVFDTHHHGDHSYGNAVWTQNGATTLAFKGVAEEMKRYEPARWQQAAKQRADVAEMKLESVEPPKQVINEDLFVLNDGKRRVEFRHFGWAHTRGDGFVYLPKDQLVCTGDAVVNGPYNYTADGNIANWPNVVRSVAKLKVKYVLPGHGEPGGREVLSGQEQFFVELRQAVKAAIDQGKKVDGLAAELHLPDSVRQWVGDSFATQVKDTYEEITQGKPHGDLPH
jgi:glyoxylase-like metal-dependent hydrolase (beta-lactamase superfamily II)